MSNDQGPTPRTDTETHIAEGDFVTGDFARQLERELAAATERNGNLIAAFTDDSCDALEKLEAANERIRRLEAVVTCPHTLWQNWLRGTVALPAGIGDVRQYQDHIRRLEEAGDAMAKDFSHFWTDRNSVRDWPKAKEAKP